MNYRKTFRAPKSVKLKSISTTPEDDGITRAEAEQIHLENVERIKILQYNLYAEAEHSVLLVLQGMDTSGKDGAIRKVLGQINPQGCEVTSFKKPTDEEMAHDYLWRIHKAAPAKGMIGVFNRSHYEDVLIVRVRNLVPRRVWSKRYDHLNQFEELLTDSNTTIIKCFLHIDKEEQRERLQSRIDEKDRQWKFNPADLDERELWSGYQKAYEVALEKCNPTHAPWFIVPANKKWYRNLIISSLILETLESLNPKPPKPKDDYSEIVVK